MQADERSKRRRRNALPGLFLFVGGWLALYACGGNEGRTPVLVYSPHGRDLLLAVEHAYETAHPQIDVRWLDMGSQEVLDRVRSERANPQADLWFGGPSTLFRRAEKEGLLAAGEHPVLVLYATPTAIVYNSSALGRDEAPDDWAGLLDPIWRDRIMIRDPLASGTMRTIFGFLLARSLEETGSEEAGFDYLRALDAQTKEYVHSPALLHEKIVRQEAVVTVWELTDILNLMARGAPLAYRFPSSGAPVIEDSAALVGGGKHPGEAQELLDWLASPEGLRLAAEKAFRLPSRLGVEGLPPWVDEVQQELRVASVDWELLEERTAEWMSRWDREVRGRGTPRR